MRPWKSILAIVVLLFGTAATGSALAHHRDWHHRGHGAHSHSHSHYVAPRSESSVYFGFSVGAPVYVYEPAPYYYHPAPTRYYYGGPAYYYYAPAWPPDTVYTD